MRPSVISGGHPGGRLGHWGEQPPVRILSRNFEFLRIAPDVPLGPPGPPQRSWGPWDARKRCSGPSFPSSVQNGRSDLRWAPGAILKISFFDSESALGAAPPSGRACTLAAHPGITDGLMDPQGRVFGAGGSTGASYVSHDVYRGRSNSESSQNQILPFRITFF